ncbi:hypothetical protein ABEP42_14060 [Priestia megaterium]|uniref:hypothetical protein n=1 Tax=Priestia megaterium TaxID=1404 RepID=UPI0003450984|nr:hypothetical protein [Priestia megaterium]AYE50846.1 hypothetical protein OEA_14130 [Priestia megaterium NCT-2]UMZ30840.1 hypothetical protein MGJ28_14715 [Priestia megaterium]
MKKVLFYLFPLALFCVVSLTGCNLFDEKEKETSKQTSAEENSKDKESENEEKNKTSKDEAEKSKVGKSETSNQASSSKENSVTQPKEAPKKVVTSQLDWGSAWTRDINTDWAVIEITEQKEDTIKFNINSIHTDNAEAARGGYINVGDVKGTAKVSGNVATQTTDEIDNGCMVKMINHQSYIQVEPITDCSGGGGLGVYFEGKYKKGDIPATDWWKKESSGNGETGEPKEEPNQTTEKEQSTDDAEGATIEDTQTSLTREQAIQRVKEYLNLSLENMRYVDEGDTATGKYLIRVYQYQEATADSTEHEAPYGYFIVDPRTGEVTDVNND